LGKYFDPYIFKNLAELTVEELRWIRLAVAFWDLGGFSVMCNELRDDNPKITYFLKTYFNEAAKIISKRNGILDKFIGDGILAYFGFIDDPHSPRDSIMATLDLKSSFEKIKEEHESLWLDLNGKKIHVHLRCGLHIGKVIFGILDTELRRQVTVIGRDVNLASRLVEFAKKDEIIVSEDLRNIARKEFRFGKIRVTSRAPYRKIKAFPEVNYVFKLRGII
jgi:class 3 adenylate cyclase